MGVGWQMSYDELLEELRSEDPVFWNKIDVKVKRKLKVFHLVAKVRMGILGFFKNLA